MEDRVTSLTESPSRKDKLLENAGDLADLLTKRAGIKKVGIVGSLARGKENPSDLDFVIFLPPEKVLEHRIDAALRTKTPWYERLDLNESVQDSLKIVLGSFGSNGINLDVHFLPESFDKKDGKMLKLMFALSGDPSYMINAVRDILIFDSSSGIFKKETIYSPEQISQLEVLNFEALKSLVNDEQRLDEFAQHRGSLKRRSSPAVQQVVERFKNRK